MTPPLSLSSPSKPAQRIGSIDAVRGTAMFFVCLAHFEAVYLWHAGARDLASYLATISMIASPTFVMVSGMVVGLLAVANPPEFEHLRIKLIDRGIFILVIGHLLLALTVMPNAHGFGRAFRVSFITDAISIAIIFGPTLIKTVQARTRLIAAIAIFLVDWLLVTRWHPAAPVSSLLKQYLVGMNTSSQHDAAPVFAVIPWFAVYLAATVLGNELGKLYAGSNRVGANKYLARFGAILFACGASFHGVTMLVRRGVVQPGSVDAVLLNWFGLYQKFPPGPVYLAVFGGAGLVLLAAILEIDRRRLIPGIVHKLRQVGRASLFTFVAQYAFYVGFLGRLRLPYSRFWPVLFVMSIVLLAEAASAWDAIDGNRFLTVGLAPLLRRRNFRFVPGSVRPRELNSLASVSGGR